MSSKTTAAPATRAPKRRTRYLPPGHRVLHVEVPEEIFNAAKAQALLSGHKWPEFVVELLSQVDPRKCGVLAGEEGSLPASS